MKFLLTLARELLVVILLISAIGSVGYAEWWGVAFLSIDRHPRGIGMPNPYWVCVDPIYNKGRGRGCGIWDSTPPAGAPSWFQ